jgi:hypothetical protein
MLTFPLPETPSPHYGLCHNDGTPSPPAEGNPVYTPDLGQPSFWHLMTTEAQRLNDTLAPLCAARREQAAHVSDQAFKLHIAECRVQVELDALARTIEKCLESEIFGWSIKVIMHCDGVCADPDHGGVSAPPIAEIQLTRAGVALSCRVEGNDADRLTAMVALLQTMTLAAGAFVA